MEFLGEGGAMPAAHPPPPPGNPKGLENIPGPCITQVETQPHVSDSELYLQCHSAGGQVSESVSGFSSQHLMKGTRGPGELLCIMSCPAKGGRGLHGSCMGSF